MRRVVFSLAVADFVGEDNWAFSEVLIDLSYGTKSNTKTSVHDLSQYIFV